MRFHALACDYDGTLARDGIVDSETIAALGKLRKTGRKLLMVTGRQLEDLERVFLHSELFDRIVAENGALLYDPASKQNKLLAEKPSQQFIQELQIRGVTPFSVGQVVVATWRPMETVVMETIRDLGLELNVIFNKSAVMVLPPGIDKASGIKVALNELHLTRDNVVAIGDAENDLAFLEYCGYSVAVSNAIPMLKDKVDYVTMRKRGAGVQELIRMLIDSDLKRSADF